MNEINPKTENIHPLSPIDPDIKQKKSSQTGKRAFDTILADQTNTDSTDTEVKQAASLGEIDASVKASRLNLEVDKTLFTRKLQTVMDSLDTYAAWLQDPDKTLKQTYDILEQIIDQTTVLDRKIKDDSNFNSELKQILTQLMTTAQVEQIKFNRGDYS